MSYSELPFFTMMLMRQATQKSIKLLPSVVSIQQRYTTQACYIKNGGAEYKWDNLHANSQGSSSTSKKQARIALLRYILGENKLFAQFSRFSNTLPSIVETC